MRSRLKGIAVFLRGELGELSGGGGDRQRPGREQEGAVGFLLASFQEGDLWGISRGMSPFT